MITWNEKQFLEDMPDIELFKRRVEKSLKDVMTRGISSAHGRDMITGYAYGELYDWDMYFENLFLSYFGISQYCRNGVEAFLEEQLDCGFISRTMGRKYPKPRHHFKPFLAQTALLGCRQEGKYNWLEGKYYEGLKKYLEYWIWHCDADRNGLCFWDGSDHSGMDNQSLRLGYDGVMEYEGVDLNCYLVRDLWAMGELAQELGKEKDARLYRQKAEDIAEKIDRYLWDEDTGFYYDRSEKTGKLNKKKCITGMLPLWLGTIPSDRAKRLVEEHLCNPNEFWSNYPLATWAKDEEGYYPDSREGECSWMGATWIPKNYMIFQGLRIYGYEKVALKLAQKTYELVMGETETREFYNSETGSGLGMNPFWGWSTLGYMMLYEIKNDYMASDLKQHCFQHVGKSAYTMLSINR